MYRKEIIALYLRKKLYMSQIKPAHHICDSSMIILCTNNTFFYCLTKNKSIWGIYR